MSGEHTDVAAYSLGLLEQRDRAAFEDHLATCPACAAELAELAGMADLLSGVEPVETAEEPPDEAAVVDLVRRRAAAQRRRSRWQITAAAAAAVVVLAGGAAAGIALAPNGTAVPPGTISMPPVHHSATDPATGVASTIGLVSKPFGTQLVMDLAKVRGPLRCDLIAVSKTGQREVVAQWAVPSPGYGVPGHPAHLVLAGATSIQAKDLSRILVNVVGGRTLVSIPV
jgi:hypothetical protein